MSGISILKKKEQQRKDILKVAYDIFLTKGIEGIKIRELAEASRVQVPTIYQLFHAKEMLIFEILQILSNDIEKKLFEFIDSHEHPALQVTQFGVNYIKYAINNPSLFYFILDYNGRFYYDSAGFNSSDYTVCWYGEIVVKMLSKLKSVFLNLCDAGISVYKNMTVTEEDIQVLMMLSWSSVHGLASLMLNSKSLGKVFPNIIETLHESFTRINIFSQEFLNSEDTYEVQQQMLQLIQTITIDV